MVQVAYLNLPLAKYLSVKHTDANRKQEKLGTEKRNRFYQLPYAETIPMKLELVMKWLHCIAIYHMAAKLNFNQTIKHLSWLQASRLVFEQRLFLID